MGKRGAILMSEKERQGLVVLEQVKRNEKTIAEATRLLVICHQQCWRRYRRYEEKEAAGLVHGLRGGGGNRSFPQEVKEMIAEKLLSKSLIQTLPGRRKRRQAREALPLAASLLSLRQITPGEQPGQKNNL